MNARMELNNFLCSKLHGPPGHFYTYANGRASVRLGSAVWDGEPSPDWRQARDSAAAKALQNLRNQTEIQIRDVCGLPARPKLRETDEIRGLLSQLRIRMETCPELPDLVRAEVKRILGNAYSSIDDAERLLRSNGLAEQ